MIQKKPEKKLSEKQAKAATLISALICIIASVLAFAGMIDGWLGAGIVVIAFPVFVLSLSMVLRESTKEGDYPFVGY